MDEFQQGVIAALERIANAQEGMMAIAAEARQERQEIAARMKQQFKTGFAQERANENSDPKR